MKRFYAIQPDFYEILKKHKHILSMFLHCKDVQKNKMFISISQEHIKQSCESYFQEVIDVENNLLLYRHPLKKQLYNIEFYDYFVQMDDVENPFFEVLKRKYHYYLVEDIL